MSFLATFARELLAKGSHNPLSAQGYMNKMVILVRADLLMGNGKAASQCAHAAVSCYIKASSKLSYKLRTRMWVLAGQPKIVLKVQTEKELLRIADLADEAGLVTAAIRDAGKTELKPGTITVLGIGPGPKDEIDNITKHLRLL